MSSERDVKARMESLLQDGGALLEELEGIFKTEAKLQGLADAVARLHYDEHAGLLRFCSRPACRMAHEVGTGVAA